MTTAENKPQTKRGRDLSVGDWVITSDDSAPVRIKRLSNGFYRNSRVAEWGSRDNEWCTIFDSNDYEIAASPATQEAMQ